MNLYLLSRTSNTNCTVYNIIINDTRNEFHLHFNIQNMKVDIIKKNAGNERLKYKEF